VPFLTDITDKKKAEETRNRESAINAELADLSKLLISEERLLDISNRILNSAKKLTDSAFGYVGYINPDTGNLVCPNLTRESLDKSEINHKNTVIYEFAGLWDLILNNLEPLISNHPERDIRFKCTPSGEPFIRRFISVPVFFGPRLIGQIITANAQRDYSDRDLAVVGQLATLFAVAFHRWQSEKALVDSEQQYHTTVDNLEDMLHLVDKDINLVLCNRNCAGAVKKYSGFTGDLTGKNLAEIFPFLHDIFQV